MSPQLVRGVALGVGVAAALAGAAPATASYSASVDAGTLRITGDGASDKLVLYPNSTDLVIDAGMDGTVDFTFPRAAFLGTDGQADTVTLNGTPRRDKVNLTREGATVVEAGLPTYAYITGSERAHDTVRVDTQAGDDEVYVAPAVWELTNPVVDLGADG